ncbi:MAG: hypothetical protein JXB62_19535 [Pirellulales bacterium]|nr:hypothetical protein [Pirellulales bacterium]
MRSAVLSLAATFCGVLLTAGIAGAADVIATFRGSSGDWSNSILWDSDPLFPNNGNGGLSFDVVIGGGTVTLGSEANVEAFTLASGTLRGSGTLVVHDNFDWTGGTLRGGGVTRAAGGMSLNGQLTLEDTRTLENLATAICVGDTTALRNDSRAVVSNLAGAEFVFAGDADFLGGTLNNHGTLIKQAGAAELLTRIDATLHNTGIIDVQSGRLELGGGGTNSGQFQVAAAAMLELSGGTYLFDTETTITGHGASWLAGATVTGSAALGFSHIFLWTDGTMAGSGSTNVDAGMILQGYLVLDDTRTLNNAAEAVFRGDDSLLHNAPGTTLNNLTGGRFTFAGDADYSGGTFRNEGTLLKQNGYDDGVTSLDAFLDNPGTADVQSGTLSLAGGGSHRGAFTVDDGATLEFAGGTHTLEPGMTLGGTGRVDFRSGTVDVNLGFDLGMDATFSGATVHFNQPLATPSPMLTIVGGSVNFHAPGDLVLTALELRGGQLCSRGTLRIDDRLMLGGNEPKLLAAPAAEIGNATWEGAGAVSVSAGAVLQSTGTFDVRGDATLSCESGTAVFNNGGRLVKSASVGVTRWQGVALDNAGTVEVGSGTLQLAGGGTHSGSFLGNGAVEFSGSHQFQADARVVTRTVRLAGGSSRCDGYYHVETTNVSGGSHRFDMVADTNALNLSAGSLLANDVFLVGGPVVWTGGAIGGSGVLHAGGGIDLGGFLDLHDSVRLDNAAVATFHGDSSFLNNSAEATWNNLAGSQLVFDGDGDFQAGTLNNAGTLVKRAGGSDGVSRILATFRNSGSVEVQSGTLRLFGDGAHSGSFRGNGAIELTGGTTHFNGPYALAATTVSGGRHHFGTTADIGTLGLIAGNLQGGGTVHVAAAMTWSGGSMGGNGLTHAGGGMHLSGTLRLEDSRTLENAGDATFDGDDGHLTIAIAAVLNNLAGGSLTFAGDGDLQGGTLNNHATLVKQAGGDDGVTRLDRTALNSAGAVEVQGGTLSLGGGGTHLGEFTGSGTLEFSGGIHRLEAASAVQVASVRLSGGQTVIEGMYQVAETAVSGGSHDFHAAADTGSLTVTSGFLVGEGTLDVAGQTQWTGGRIGGGLVINARGGMYLAGNPSLDDTAVLHNAGDAIVEGNDGVIHLDATFSNSGTVEVQSGTLRLGGGSSSGAFQVAADATLQLAGDAYTFDGGTAVRGQGSVVFGGGSVRLALTDELIAVEGDVYLDGVLALQAAAMLETIGDQSLTLITTGGPGGLVGTFSSGPAAGEQLGLGLFLSDRGPHGQGVTYTSHAVEIDVFQAAAGDTNGDRVVNGLDIQAILAANKFGLDVDTDWTEGDFTGDRRFNGSDVQAMLAANLFSQGPYAPPANMATNTPIGRPTSTAAEPNSLLMLLAGVLGALAAAALSAKVQKRRSAR